MEPIYTKKFHIPSFAADRFDRLKPSYLLGLAQEVAGDHSALLEADYANTGLYWVVTRLKVQITRLPASGETVTLETWPMPTTRVAFPRSTIAYDEQGQEVFRMLSLWVLMDPASRAMVLPGKSGVAIEGTVRGLEPAIPRSLAPQAMENQMLRRVHYTQLDVNGHMNNTRYLDWVEDLLPAQFHWEHPVKEFTVCYLNEAMEGEEVALNWQLDGEGCLHVHAVESTGGKRVFSAEVLL